MCVSKRTKENQTQQIAAVDEREKQDLMRQVKAPGPSWPRLQQSGEAPPISAPWHPAKQQAQTSRGNTQDLLRQEAVTGHTCNSAVLRPQMHHYYYFRQEEEVMFLLAFVCLLAR